jgi:2',3'-cyclic-nucleotide 2'-phosphodiesterase (5'-nucleotidase family)/Ca2+-binding EF-hand superfamily protein
MKTCIQQNATDNQVVLLAGDFLAPSLLSSLDHGRSMVDMLNRVGVQYVCFGNHEQDVPHMEMLERVKESQFEWINTNMERLQVKKEMPPLPTHKVLTVNGGGQTRKVGLLGLLTDDPGLYLPTAWGGPGASIIDPIIDKATEYRTKLLQEHGCDVVVPMTHQVMPLDREMAEKRLGFPLIIGGHDHQLYHEEIAGATVIKMGADADTIGIIDLTWPDSSTQGEAPFITIQKIPAEQYPPDPDLVERMKVHKAVLEELDKAALFEVPRKMKLTSKKIRLGQVSMGTILVTALRKAFGAECAMINAGNIRGNTEYPDSLREFTYSQLKSEMPFDSVVAEIPLPGRVINETVRFTRQWAIQDPPVEKGCYMQLDNRMTWDPATNTVTHINRQPLELDRIYECVVLWQVAMEGIDKVTPLHDYCKEHFSDKYFPHDADVGRPAKQILVDYFGRAVWWHLIESAGGFSGLDADGDGRISEEDLRQALAAAPPLARRAVTEAHGLTEASGSLLQGELGDLVIKNIMAMADTAENGYISKAELLQVSLLCVSMFEDADEGKLSKEEVRRRSEGILGEDYCDKLVDGVFDAIDIDGDGSISLLDAKKRRSALDKPLKI